MATDRGARRRPSEGRGTPLRTPARNPPDCLSDIRQRERVHHLEIAHLHAYGARSSGKESQIVAGVVRIEGEGQGTVLFIQHMDVFRLRVFFDRYIYRADGSRLNLPLAKRSRRHPAQDIGDQQRRRQLVFHRAAARIESDDHLFGASIRAIASRDNHRSVDGLGHRDVSGGGRETPRPIRASRRACATLRRA